MPEEEWAATDPEGHPEVVKVIVCWASGPNYGQSSTNRHEWTLFCLLHIWQAALWLLDATKQKERTNTLDDGAPTTQTTRENLFFFFFYQSVLLLVRAGTRLENKRQTQKECVLWLEVWQSSCKNYGSNDTADRMKCEIHWHSSWFCWQ